jgi:flagellar motor switch protein FliN/FliY
MADTKPTTKPAAPAANAAAAAASTSASASPAAAAKPATGPAERFPELAEYLDVPIRIAIELGRRPIAVRDLLALEAGAVFELSKLTGEPVDIVIGNRAVARGEIVVSGEELVARVSQIVNGGEDLP